MPVAIVLMDLRDDKKETLDSAVAKLSGIEEAKLFHLHGKHDLMAVMQTGDTSTLRSCYDKYMGAVHENEYIAGIYVLWGQDIKK